MKEQDANLILSNIGFKALVSKIPLLRYILF